MEVTGGSYKLHNEKIHNLLATLHQWKSYQKDMTVGAQCIYDVKYMNNWLGKLKQQHIIFYVLLTMHLDISV